MKWWTASILSFVAVAVLGVTWLQRGTVSEEPARTERLPNVKLPPPPKDDGADPQPPADGTSQPIFEELPAYETGLQFSYFADERMDRMFGAETNGAGLGWIDFDANGHPDLYVLNGCRLPHDPRDPEFLDALFLNRGDGTFFDAASLAGLHDNQFGQGVAVGDYDNDGWDDLYVCNFGTNALYRNCGDGTFRALSGDIGAGATGWNAGAAFADIDHDGDLDLYVTVYALADLENVPVCYDSATGTHRVYCGPDRYESTRHHFFLNNGDGVLWDATAECGCDKTNGKGMGVVIADLDHDTWPEIFVANDMTPSFLYRNLHRSPGQLPRFEEIGAESGVAFNGNGRLVAGMGIACGDADGDGWLDLYVSHYHRQGNTFYRNQHRLCFADDTAAVNLLVPSLPYLGFGCEFFDYDNDGWLDLYVVNGHVLGPNYPLGKMRPQVYRNQNGKGFSEVTSRAGPYFQGAYLGRGSATCDFDSDGAVDLAVLHLDYPVTLLRNALRARGQSIGFQCSGAPSNRDGINAELTLHVDGQELTRQVLGGGSYQSAPDLRVLVGTGSRSHVDRLQVRWPSGARDLWNHVATGGLYLLREGSPPRLLRRWGSDQDVQE